MQLLNKVYSNLQVIPEFSELAVLSGFMLLTVTITVLGKKIDALRLKQRLTYCDAEVQLLSDSTTSVS